MILLTLLLALCLARVQYVACKFNQSARWNGLGAIPGVQARVAGAPMAYRVLAAWALGKHANPNWYQVFMLALIWGALYSVYLAWGSTVMLITAILLTVTFWYDYWDIWPELIGFSLALVSFPLALIGVAIHGLSRETAFLVGLVYGLHSNDWLGAAILTITGVVILALVRVIQGKHPLYCDRFMISVNKDLLIHFKPPYILSPQHISLVVCALACAGAWGRADGLIVPVLIGAGWILAKGNETRIFAAVLPYAAHLLKGLL